MATFLHRLCLFGVLAATGFALSNCQNRDEAEGMVSADERETDVMVEDYFSERGSQFGYGGGGTAGTGAPLDTGMKPDAGRD